jgi:hypothetical protein
MKSRLATPGEADYHTGCWRDQRTIKVANLAKKLGERTTAIQSHGETNDNNQLPVATAGVGDAIGAVGTSFIWSL